MDLFYDPRDDRYHEARRSQILYWLDDLGAKPLNEARADSTGFLFAGGRGIEDYRSLICPYPLLRDRPDEREPLLRLDTVLQTMHDGGVTVDTPQAWSIPLDAPIPPDIRYPLFVRTAETSMKLGGRISRVRSERELLDEMGELRRTIRWDAIIVAREWMNLAPAGRSTYGDLPQEVRVWAIDGAPYTWSFHHQHIIPHPTGFPPSRADLDDIRRSAGIVAACFRSRLTVADFARTTQGRWVFIEAGPGSCAGTANEGVFKAVASRLVGEHFPFEGNKMGGLFAG